MDAPPRAISGQICLHGPFMIAPGAKAQMQGQEVTLKGFVRALRCLSIAGHGFARHERSAPTMKPAVSLHRGSPFHRHAPDVLGVFADRAVRDPAMRAVSAGAAPEFLVHPGGIDPSAAFPNSRKSAWPFEEMVRGGAPEHHDVECARANAPAESTSSPRGEAAIMAESKTRLRCRSATFRRRQPEDIGPKRARRSRCWRVRGSMVRRVSARLSWAPRGFRRRWRSARRGRRREVTSSARLPL